MNKLKSFEDLQQRFCWTTGELHRTPEEHTCRKRDLWRQCAYTPYLPSAEQNWFAFKNRREWDVRLRVKLETVPLTARVTIDPRLAGQTIQFDELDLERIFGTNQNEPPHTR